MARKKVPVKAPARAASYSSSEDGSSSSEDEQPSNVKKLLVPTTSTPATSKLKKNPPKPAAASSSEDGSEDGNTSDDDDSDNPARPSGPSSSEKKLPSKAPSQSDSKDSEPDSPPANQASAAEKAISSKSVGGARSGASASRGSKVTAVDEKKQKSIATSSVTTPSSPSTSGKKPFVRLWTDEDEIAILEGLILFRGKHGHELTHLDFETFVDLVKSNLHTEFNKKQLMNKVRKMKYKFMGMASKKEKDGSEKVYNKPHEQLFFDLGKKAWVGKVKAGEDGSDDGHNVKGEMKEEKGKKRQKSMATKNALASSKKQRRMTTGAVPPVVPLTNTVASGAVPPVVPLTNTVASGSETGLVNAVENSHPLLSNFVDHIESANMGTLMAGSLKTSLRMLKPDKIKHLEGKLKKHYAFEIKTQRIRMDLAQEVLLGLEEELSR